MRRLRLYKHNLNEDGVCFMWIDYYALPIACTPSYQPYIGQPKSDVILWWILVTEVCARRVCLKRPQMLGGRYAGGVCSSTGFQNRRAGYSLRNSPSVEVRLLS